MNFYDLVGQEFLFYGVDNHLIKLNDTVFEVLEDEDDGYRSMLGEISIISPKRGIFFREPVSIVKVGLDNDDQYCDGYKLSDVEYKHIWLRFGTNSSDDYYPSFYFLYSPMKPEARNNTKRIRPISNYYIDELDWLFEERHS